MLVSTPETTSVAPTHRLSLKWYRDMLLLRRFEEEVYKIYKTVAGRINGFCHLYIGQEAVAVGAVAAIRPDDHVITAYRDHGHGLARGMTCNECMAELFGKVTGCSKGKGGSMHYFSVKNNFWGGHGIVGGQVPLGTGLAFASKYKKEDTVTLCFMGDGAIHQGAVHEAMNMAGLFDLPIIYVIENNLYAMGTHVNRHSSVGDLTVRATSYGMRSQCFDGMDIDEVYANVTEAVEQARNGKPSLLEARCYRYRGHSMADPEKYRAPGEMADWKKNDPLAIYGDRLRKHGLLDDRIHVELEAEVKAVVQASVEFAESSPEPGPEELFTDIFAENQP